jgi:uncharacterized protein (DUF58 family)
MKVRTIVFIIPVVLLALALVGGSTLLLRLFFLSVLVPVVSYTWSVLGIHGINAEAEPPPAHSQVGERFQQRITVTNDSRIPKLWLRVEESTDLPGRREPAVLNLPQWGSHEWQSTFTCHRRGRYYLGAVTVTATDPFGLFSRQRTVGEPHSILIYPATIDLPLFKASSFNEFGYGSGYQAISQISPNASSVREFSSGDSLNHIHWPGTAHTGKLLVKVFDADRSYDSSKTVWIILDMQETSHFGHGEETTEEYGVTIAASLARKHLQSGMRVGLAASGEQTYLIPPERGDDHLWRMLEALALIRATGEVSVGQVISDHMEYLRGNSTVIIVTPAITGSLADAVRQLKNRVDSIVVVLLDPASFGGETSMANAARNLSSTGVQVYIVRQGDELARALDNRASLLHARFM